MKSWGYTSAQGSYWANGNSKTAFMAIFATAHNKPLHVSAYDPKYQSYNSSTFSMLHPGSDCLFAHGGTGMLRNDEVVVYNENQATINYIVEFKLP